MSDNNAGFYNATLKNCGWEGKLIKEKPRGLEWGVLKIFPDFFLFCVQISRVINGGVVIVIFLSNLYSH